MAGLKLFARLIRVSFLMPGELITNSFDTMSFKAMLRRVLEDRFQLKTHQSQKEFAVYAITVSKGGLKMKESAESVGTEAAPSATNVDVKAGEGTSTTVNLGNGSSISLGDHSIECIKITMAVLADQLSRMMDRPVVDQSDLKGSYDFKLDFSPEEFMALRIRQALSAGVQMPPQALKMLENSSDAPLLNALQSLGLKLESRKAPLEVLVADSVLKVPIEN